MNKTSLSLATAMIATMAGGISLPSFAPQYQASANAEQTLQPIAANTETLQQPAQQERQGEIAKIYAHQMDGRKAVTVYVRNIPVATYLGESSVQDQSVEVATTGVSDIPTLSKAMKRATDLVVTINESSASEAEKIGVKWDKNTKQYVIHLDNEPLISMNGNVILPRSTKSKAEDALQITNRLRRQIGNLKPLTAIEGQPKPPVEKVAVAPTNIQQYQQGWASWYGPGFHGNYTASGARYNQYGLTAAHRTLPFGTKLRVTNLDNGRSVIVTVNDRGPFIHNRVIDLSMGAAQVLGVVNSGVAPVRVDFVN